MRDLSKDKIEDILGLTPTQEGILFQYIREPEGGHYFEQLELKISGIFNKENFEQAWAVVVQSNEMLRTFFHWEKTLSPFQVVLKTHRVIITYHDISAANEDIETQQLERIKLKDRQEYFDLTRVPFRIIVCNRNSGSFHIIISSHHILYDGWSTGIILNEFFHAYHCLLKGQIPVLPKKNRFKQYIKWTRQYDNLTIERFWKNYLADWEFESGLPLIKQPLDGKRERGEGFGHLNTVLSISMNRIDEFTGRYRVTTAALLYSACGLLLQKYGGVNDSVLGTTISVRPPEIMGVEEMVGLFINVLPLRITTISNSREPVWEFIRRVNTGLQVRDAYKNTPSVEIKGYTGNAHAGNLFDLLVTIENYPLEKASFESGTGLCVESFSAVEQPHYEISLTIFLQEAIEIHCTYNRSIYNREYIAGFCQHLALIVEGAVENPDVPIDDLDILSIEEKEQILYTFNRYKKGDAVEKLLPQLYSERAGTIGDRIALVEPGGSLNLTNLSKKDNSLWIFPGKNQHVSYKGLLIRIQDSAKQLKRMGVGEISIVGIMMERSIQLVEAIFATLEIGGVYLPIDPGYPIERRNYIVKDSGAQIVLSTNNRLQIEQDSVPGATSSNCFSDKKPAYIIYTSGTTGRPKGVMISHSSVINLLSTLQKEYPFNQSDAFLFKTSVVFDVSVPELFGWISGGGKLVVLEPTGEKDPQLLANTIAKQGITYINFVPSMFNAFTDYLAVSGIVKEFNLKYIFLAGEVLLPETVSKFNQFNTTIRMVNLYGPTEATVYATGYSIPYKSKLETLFIGKPLEGTVIYIISTDNWLQPVGIPGELVITGAGLAMGYLNHPEMTAEKFYYLSSCKYFSLSHSPSRPISYSTIYRSGDLARWYSDGNIEFLGRIDHQVKIRGFRIELGEIENNLLRIPHIKDSVVVIRVPQDREPYLCAYITSSTKVTGEEETQWIEEIKNRLSQQLPVYMVPEFFVFLDELPYTATGKVDKRSLPDPEFRLIERYRAPETLPQKQLVGIWSEVLGIDAEKIGIDDNFFELHGHSLKAIAAVVRIHRLFNISIPMGEFFKRPTIRELSLYMNEKDSQSYVSIPVVEEKEYYPLTNSQKRFFILQHLDTSITSYNMPEVLHLRGNLDKERIEWVFRRLINRHEMLRTSFRLVKGEPVQIIHPEVAFRLEHIEMNGTINMAQPLAVEASKRFIRPFDLSQSPLMRAGLMEISLQEYLLLFDMHHLIGDGVSIGVFIGDFCDLYNAEELQPLRIRYRDYVNWKLKPSQRVVKKAKGALYYDEDKEEGIILNLPTDFDRPQSISYEGARIRFSLSLQESAAINRLILNYDVTLYITLLAVYTIWLSKLSGQEKIAVGSPIAGRTHVDLDRIIGLFLNILCMRNDIPDGISFSELLARVKKNTLETFENQEFQYHELVEKANISRNAGRNPLFDVMLVLQNMDMPEVRLNGLTAIRDIGDYFTSKFDLTLYCEEKNQLEFLLEYSTSLFREETIKRFIGYFKRTIREVIENPDIKVSQIEIIPTGERQRVLDDFNNTIVPGAKFGTVYEAVTRQAIETPDRIAITGLSLNEPGKRSSISYSFLNHDSNRLAWLHRSKGVKANCIVGLMMERSLEMIIGILSILKAGGTYLPIDTGYPVKRIIAMLNNSGAGLLLTGQKELKLTGSDSIEFSNGAQIVTFEDTTGERETLPTRNPEPVSGPTDLIYVIFTSGSTGKPKGAGVYHYSFMNLMHWFVTEFNFNSNDSGFLLTSSSFDLTQKSIYGPLMTGGVLYIPGMNFFDPPVLLREIRDYEVTWINCTPSMFSKLVEQDALNNFKYLRTLRWVFLGGEPFGLIQIRDWLENYNCNGIIANTYGPTECTDICGSFVIKEPSLFYDKTIPVGKPVYNAEFFVLCKGLQLLPVGIAGELYIGGRGVGPGYINAPELTAQKFIRHHFPKRAFENQKGKDMVLYRTGDLTKWDSSGNIIFLGRIDDQVKVRGFRIELGEIESNLTGHPEIKEAVVVARPVPGGDKLLCAYFVTQGNRKINIDRLKEQMASELPNYMVPASFNCLEKMPLSPNGKIDRKSLPEPELTQKRVSSPPVTYMHRIMVKIWGEVLGIDSNKISITDDFFQLGGHSLKAAALLARVHKEFSIEIPLIKFFKTPTVEAISTLLDNLEKSNSPAINPVEKKEYYPLSSSQKRLWIIQRMDENSTKYNMPFSIIVKGDLDESRCLEAFKYFIRRHESLRTSFQLVNEQPVQRVHHLVDFDINRISPEFRDSLFSAFLRPFNLATPPLFRVGIMSLETPGEGNNKAHILAIDMHHIISDGLSMNIFIREFPALYQQHHLGELIIQYKDFSVWQNHLLEKGELKSQEEYWLRCFADEVPALILPYDYPRPPIQLHEGKQYSFELDEVQSLRINQWAQESKGTAFIVLLSLYNLVLAKWSGQEDLVIGTPVSGRKHVDVEPVIGMFVNTLALRNSPLGTKPFDFFLEEVRRNFHQALDNQDYQYEKLVEKVLEERDLSRNPLFDVTLVMQNMPATEVQLPGMSIEICQDEINTAKFDISLMVQENQSRYKFTVTYCSSLFKEESICRFENYFKQVISAISPNTHQYIFNIEVLSQSEKEFVLFSFNQTDREYPEHDTLTGLFLSQAARTPKHIVLAAQDLINDNALDSYALNQVTYGFLAEKSTGLADLLIEKGTEPGSLVAIMANRSLEMIFGLLGILGAGCAYLPIDPDFPPERVWFMLTDSNAKLLLKAPTIRINDVFGSNSQQISVSSLQTIDLDIETIEPSSLHCNPVITPKYPAYVLFTSGSTGKPKGVMVEHGSVVNIVVWFGETFRIDGDTRVVLLPDYTFDPSVNQIFASLLRGAVLYIIQKQLLGNSLQLRRWIEIHKIHLVYTVPGLLSQLLGGGKKLPDVHFVLSGGDRLTETIKNNLINLGYTVYNLYGPTETTIDALTDYCSSSTVSLGNPIANVQCFILDKYFRIVPPGTPGELCIGGKGVSRGYLNRPELTAERFLLQSPGDFLSSNSTAYPQTRAAIYRTGDLARMNWNGKFEFLGRMDHQVKVRGYRIELGEIQNQLLAVQGIKEAVVVAKEDLNSDKNLFAYIVAAKTVEVSELKNTLSVVLPPYMLPQRIIQLDMIPLTPNGKVDYGKLPTSGFDLQKEYIPPTNEIEQKLQLLWYEILGREEKIGIYDNFFQLGGHSLKAARMTARIHKTFNVELSLADIFLRPTLRGLSQWIEGHVKHKYHGPVPVEEKEYYPLSHSQQRLYLLHNLDMEGIAYNMPAVVSLQGQLEISHLNKVFNQLILKHESLRTSFVMVSDTPVQLIKGNVEIEIRLVSMDNIAANDAIQPGSERYSDVIKEFIKAFDLTQAPLFRVGIITISETEHILMLDMHHIISDGISTGIIIQDFMKLASGETSLGKGLRYRDYSEWQKGNEWKNFLKAQQQFWISEFTGEIPVLNLPIDSKSPVLQSSEGKSLYLELSEEITAAIKDLSNKSGTTLFMALSGLYAIFLSKLSGQQDLIVGTPVAGRRFADLESIVGMFVNTLPLRFILEPEMSFVQNLEVVKRKTLECFRNQDYPLERLVEQLNIPRETGRNPLFDTLFAFQDLDIPNLEISGLKLNPVAFENNTAKFPLSLYVSDQQKTLKFSLEYNTCLFKDSTAKRFLEFFITIIAGVLANPGKQIKEIEIIGKEEKKKLLNQLNDTDIRFDQEISVMELFSSQAKQKPDYCALQLDREHTSSNGNRNVIITYKQLEEESNERFLRFSQLGIGPGSIVGLKMQRSLKLISTLWGILKAGAVYLPLAPDYPEERVNYIVKDSGAQMVLSANDGFEKELSLKPASFNAISNSARLPVYIIYTSGTTGKPKGVIVEHQSLLNIIWDLNRRYPVSEKDKILFKTSIVFDVSITEIFGWYIGGGCLTLLESGGEIDPQVILNTIARTGVTHMNFVPSMFSIFLEVLKTSDFNLISSVKYIFLAGEALDPAIVRTTKKVLTGVNLENLYGPTEATIYASGFSLNRWEDKGVVPIGKPLANIQFYILDFYNLLQPIGIPGELCISGAGLARGYLNKPEMTAEKFCPFTPGDTFQENHPLGLCDRILYFHSPIHPLAQSTIYRTGDLARWNPEGNVEFMGRLDNQVKVRGYRIELGEIESVLLKNRHVRDAVVIPREESTGDKYLCAYIVFTGEKENAIQRLREFLKEHLPAYMEPAYFVLLDKMPVTLQGKVDKLALPSPLKIDQENITAPATEITEIKLAEIWSNLLGIEKNKIGADAHFFQLGGHSLKANQMIFRVNNIFKISIPLLQVFKTPHLRDIARYIRNAQSEQFYSIQPSEKKEFYPLSESQRRIYTLQQLEKNSVAYNMPTSVKLEGKLDFGKLEHVLNQLIQRHESLRTSFQTIEHGAVQIIKDINQVEFHLEKIKTADEFIRPFQLSNAPLIRVGIKSLETNVHLLILDMHHIVSDGISLKIVVEEVMSLYREESLPLLELQYSDYAQWQKSKPAKAILKKQEEYWLNKYKGKIPKLKLPYDNDPPKIRNYKGKRYTFRLETEETESIKQLALEEDATIYMICVAMFSILMGKLVNQEDVIIGTVTAGRPYRLLEPLVGMFANTLALRNAPLAQKPFSVFLMEVKQSIIESLENQDYAFDRLVQELGLSGETRGNALFDVGFSWETQKISQIQIPDFILKPFSNEPANVKFDMIWIGTEAGGNLEIIVEYASEVLTETTIASYSKYFREIITAVIKNKDIAINEIKLTHRLLSTNNKVPELNLRF